MKGIGKSRFEHLANGKTEKEVIVSIIDVEAGGKRINK